MNAPSNLTEAFAVAKYRAITPTWFDYSHEGLVGKRVIIERWHQLRDELNRECDLTEWAKVTGRIHRAHIENNPSPSIDRLGDNEEYEGEAVDRGVDGRGFNLTNGGDL